MREELYIIIIGIIIVVMLVSIFATIGATISLDRTTRRVKAFTAKIEAELRENNDHDN